MVWETAGSAARGLAGKTGDPGPGPGLGHDPWGFRLECPSRDHPGAGPAGFRDGSPDERPGSGERQLGLAPGGRGADAGPGEKAQDPDSLLRAAVTGKIGMRAGRIILIAGPEHPAGK